jgi:hypothetical protein
MRFVLFFLRIAVSLSKVSKIKIKNIDRQKMIYLGEFCKGLIHPFWWTDIRLQLTVKYFGFSVRFGPTWDTMLRSRLTVNMM